MSKDKNRQEGKVVKLVDRAKINFAQKLGRSWNYAKYHFATTLGRKESQLTMQRKKIYFFIFFGSLTLLCLYFMVDGINGFYNVVNDKKQATSLNLSFGNIGSVALPDNNVIDSRERRVLRFINYLDSLKNSPAGKAKYDSISKSRPGLIDSLEALRPNLSIQSKF
ncbi:hypothetical protein AAKU52_002637 [Pedobacter sp. CG_S7]|uniref:hypothetical protein n=1 Tax=Pedobacter sp. CG_S7 TaxID=3143930 RepID=UPI0033959DC4